MPTPSKLSFADFVKKAVVALRKRDEKGEPIYKGIHSRNSGFNSAFRKYYDLDVKSDAPIKAIEKLEAEKVIQTRGCKGGVMIYLAGEYEGDTVDKTLGKILG